MERFVDTYAAYLVEALREVSGGRLMPGVAELLDALSRHDEIV